MTTIGTILSAGLLLLASLLALLAAVGLLRFNTVMARTHPVTKAITLGVVAVCVAGALRVEDPTDALRLLLVAVFQIVTAPIAAHMVARAAHRVGSGGTRDLPIDELRESGR